ncbi:MULTISPECIES: hypothetical protein [Streptomyces]|uniref:hypothetical protein n=1 Tax=Streptomyces TaxID=1883 RepID=UPI00187317FD|nr:hypothetical protein [Streptomyces caniscabiei]MBE4797397.1 hypothetical protein [Streptomyces caniscabiei]
MTDQSEIPEFIPSDHPQIQERIQEALGEVNPEEAERMYQAAKVGSVHLTVDVSGVMGKAAYTVVEVAVSRV